MQPVHYRTRKAGVALANELSLAAAPARFLGLAAGRTLAVALSLAATLPASALAAQEASGPPASQHGTVAQTVNRTTITAGYDRPVARGRVLFGDDGLIAYDALWTPGANRATWLEFSTDVEINGHPVAAGRYSLWTIPRSGPWTAILNRTWDTHHAIYPGDVDDALRLDVSTEPAAHMEALALYFPVVGPYSTTLRVHWGTVSFALQIEVPR
jgi:hypothetical protein